MEDSSSIVRLFSARSRGYQDQDEEPRVEDRSAAEINNSVGMLGCFSRGSCGGCTRAARIVDRPVGTYTAATCATWWRRGGKRARKRGGQGSARGGSSDWLNLWGLLIAYLPRCISTMTPAPAGAPLRLPILLRPFPTSLAASRTFSSFPPSSSSSSLSRSPSPRRLQRVNGWPI